MGANTVAMEQPKEQAEQGTSAPKPSDTIPAEMRQLAVSDNRPVEIQKFEFQQRCARLFAASGLFADIKGQSPEQSIAQAFVKIALGDSMGFNPAESMTGIDIIQGRVSVGSSLRAARMQRAGYSWDILQLDEKGCRLGPRYKGAQLMCEVVDGDSGEVRKVPAVVSFTVEDAAKAGLIGKDNYKKNPRNMFFARAITNTQRWYAPGILGVDILSTEEAIDMEPISTRDEGLAAKAASVANGIKERYASKSISSEASVTPISDPPLAPEQAVTSGPNQTTEPDPVSQEQRDKIKSQVREIENRRATKTRSEPNTLEQHGTPVSFGEGK